MSQRPRGRIRRALFLVAFWCVVTPAVAHAQEMTLGARTLAPLFALQPQQALQPQATLPVVTTDSGRRAIVPMYVAFAALQALDAHTTLAALDAGGREGNPLMAGIADKPAAFIALKAATGAGVIYLTERIRVRNRVHAFVLMAAVNSLYATVVAHNYRTLSRLGR